MSDPRSPEVREWMKRTEALPPDENESARQVISRLTEVRQRTRWWPFPVVYRGAESASRASKSEPSPIVSTKGDSATVTGRTKSMFSPVKAIAASALAFAIGGTLLIAQPFDQQGSGVPGAEGDTVSVAATWVTGTVSLAAFCSAPTASTSEAGVQPELLSSQCGPQRWSTSDPRLTGTATEIWNDAMYEVDGATVSVRAGIYDVQNESGGWLCRHPDGLTHGSGPYAATDNEQTVTCAGDGAYDGLTAILFLDWSNSPPSSVPLDGLIFSGEPPPLPERPASE